jgi:hypothetical protein
VSRIDKKYRVVLYAGGLAGADDAVKGLADGGAAGENGEVVGDVGRGEEGVDVVDADVRVCGGKERDHLR